MSDFNERYSALRCAVIEREFAQLNDRQRDGVLKTEGPLLILAGAGSGKTTVLINRIINLLKFGSAYECTAAPSWAGDSELLKLALALEDPDCVPQEELRRLCAVDPPKPYEIIAITFTNKAAAELRERLNVACGSDAMDIWAHTFHSACARILRSHITNLGYSSNFTIYDEDDKKKLLHSIIKDMGINDKTCDIKAIVSNISRAKDSLQNAQQYAAEADVNDPIKQITARIFIRYEEQMRTLNALDFDDMIVKTVELLRTCPDVLAYYQHKFRYVLVDEYQDTNHAQYVLCSLLSGGSRNLCVVGDDDQSIYKFRGATIENILEFEQQYPDAFTIRLEQNYRSTGSILNAANGLIAKNRGRKGKTLWTDKGDGDPICVYAADNQDDEAQFIADRINQGHRSGRYFRDFAVLYRNHVLSNSIEMAFKRSGIPYRIVSGLRFFDRAEVKDMLSYLCVIDNPDDNIRLRRIINVPVRGIGTTTQDKVSALAAQQGISDFAVINNASEYPELSKALPRLSQFCDLIQEFAEKKDGDLLALYDLLLEKSGYMAMLEQLPQAEKQTKKENVLELRSNITNYCENTEEPTLHGFLEEIALFTDIDIYDPDTDAVTMMTIHSAKGLEFDSVFVCGTEEGIFPSDRAVTDSEQLEEERRLCYVALTRAKKNLYITTSQRRMLYGRTAFSHPSRFIDEIPSQYINRMGSIRTRSMSADQFAERRTRTAFFGNKTSSFIPPAKQTQNVNIGFKVGQHVLHKSFGEGVIIELTPMGTDAMLKISFEKGDKLLMAKTAAQFMKTL